MEAFITVVTQSWRPLLLSSPPHTEHSGAHCVWWSSEEEECEGDELPKAHCESITDAATEGDWETGCTWTPALASLAGLGAKIGEWWWMVASKCMCTVRREPARGRSPSR